MNNDAQTPIYGVFKRSPSGKGVWIVSGEVDRLKCELAAAKVENAALREHVRNLLPYAYMLMREEKPLAAYADLLPYVIADAEAASKKEIEQR